MARYIATKVTGMDVPEEIINRLKGVHGIHLMAIEWEHMCRKCRECPA